MSQTTQESVPSLRRTQTHSAVWALTLRSEDQIETLMNYTTETPSVDRCLIGHREVSPEGQEHWHVLITFKVLKPRQWVGIFGQALQNMWIRALRPYHQESQRQATSNYARYCVKEGEAVFELNIPREWTGRIHTDDNMQIDHNIEEAEEEEVTIPARKKTKTTDIIRDRIEAGATPKDLYHDFPGCVNIINNLMPLHKLRYNATYCLYIWGPTGVGKTTGLKRVLNFLRDQFDITYYFKLGGLSKFFNGYQFDDIIVIDDPVEPGQESNEQVQMFKSIINEHERHVEIKGSSMPLDTKLVIITANISPQSLANACGPTCRDAIYRRLTKPFKPVHLTKPQHDRYLMYLLKQLANIFDLHFPIEQAYLELEEIVQPPTDIEF